MQQPTGGTPRPDAGSTDRDQAPANPPIQRLSGRASRALRDRVRSRAAAVGDVLRTALRPFTSAERALPIAVASIVAVAALLAFLPTTPAGRRQRHPGIRTPSTRAWPSTAGSTAISSSPPRSAPSTRRPGDPAPRWPAARRIRPSSRSRSPTRSRSSPRPPARSRPPGPSPTSRAPAEHRARADARGRERPVRRRHADRRARARHAGRGRVGPRPELHRAEGRHGAHRREEVRRVVHDPVVGQQAQEVDAQGRRRSS